MEILGSYENMEQMIKDKSDVLPVIEKINGLKDEFDFDFLKEETPSAILQSIDGIKRITSIVLAMKEFSHPATGNKVPSNINKMIESTVTIARNEWKYVAECQTSLSADLPMVSCLTGEINQVFLNIIVNAAHAIGEKRSEKGIIKISTRAEGDFVVILIEDNGSGIPDNVMDKIFDPFFTTKEVGKGTGQGLAIAYNVVKEKHNGKIEVFSEVGKGTAFEIWLPVN
jgi:signal transduction histidine kinase